MVKGLGTKLAFNCLDSVQLKADRMVWECIVTSSYNQSEHAVCQVQLSGCTDDTQTHIHVM